jgi:TRAP transporter TAXI family solute receptor
MITKTGLGTTGFLLLIIMIILSGIAWAKDSELPKSVAIGTTSVGSAPYVLSVGIADFITKYAGMNATAEVGGGGDAIARLLRDGKVQLAMLNSFSATHLYMGDLQFSKERRAPVRAILWGNLSPRQLVVREASGIKTISDFAGKRILSGRKVALDTEIVFDALMKVYGVPKGSVKEIPYSKPKEIMDALKMGTADGAIWPASAPNPLILELQEAVKLRFLSVSKEKWESLLKELGSAFFIWTLPANTYKNQPEEVYVPSIQMGFSTLKDFPEEAVYRIIKAIMSRFDEFKLIHPTAREWTLQTTLSQFCIPFHPGAIRYFKEIGVWKFERDKKQKAVLELEKILKK